MNNISHHVGEKIKFFRKLHSLSLDDLASMVHKSKSTLSKYENGQITIDIQSLHEIAQVLNVDIRQFLDFTEPMAELQTSNINSFFRKKIFYIYYYDGRKKEVIKSCLIIQENISQNMLGCTFYMDVPSFEQCEDCTFYYIGEVNCFDLVTYTTLINQINPMDRLSMCILNPFHHNTGTWGMMFGISYKPIAPFALKFLISSVPLKANEISIDDLVITSSEIKIMKKLNMMLLEETY